MSDIVEATGLNKSSIYNSFASKDELFQTALERYTSTRREMLHAVLRDGSAGLDDVMGFLDLAELEIRGELGSRGCLAINTTTERGNCDEAVVEMGAGFRGEIRSGFRAALDRAAARGEIDDNAIAHRTEMLVAFMLSLGVVARGRGSAAELDGQFAAIRSIVGGWRIES
jgi:TetR/AcrR family transcriptional repressor of nem operon